ncbi:MAG: helix-turn-helix transcriptional regulator [Bdellovibrionales bacterium]|nr:helix-turn-helix transcriptional regulator [Bdellovibrionales bacterium]
MVSAREDAKKWRAETASLLTGLGQAIDVQFEEWRLTDAEKEVGLLLLKGLSHKEIAEIRSTSEKTVRQQAASLYGKAALEGRAQLSAFFLEDLLLGVKTDAAA